MNEFLDIYTNTRFDHERAHHIDALSLKSPKRRFMLGAGVSMAGLSLLGLPTAALARSRNSILSRFDSVPLNKFDTVTVPIGYRWQVVNAWGDAIQGAAGPAFKQNASNTAADQALQSGMHHDGMSLFAYPKGSVDSSNALLAINHEYTDDGLLHTDGMATWSAEKVRKSQAAHGVTIQRVQKTPAGWVSQGSAEARRITAYTPMEITGPARGHARMKTAADADGVKVLGTLNNCANGETPWGTFLTCEENFNGYFVTDTPNPDHKRYGINSKGFGYRWHEHDERFNAALNPNEPNRFGWVVEINPYDPNSTPKKRSALGRFKHEGAMVTQAPNGKIVVYMGDDERNEYIYKFVTKNAHDPKNPERSADILDEGTLYVAKFSQDGKGEWLPLVQGRNGLTPENGFSSQAEICIKTRQAADRVGATMMDRPEWVAVHPTSKQVYVTLTNNSRRGTGTEKANAADGTTTAATANPRIDDANPRKDNSMGHIVRWSEFANNPAATLFDWDVYVLGGDRTLADNNKHNSNKGDTFGSPDGLWFDPAGNLWVQTDISTSTLGKGDYANMATNMMLVADTESGELKRFLTAPRGSEVTGAAMTADRKTMFINIQHPGESPSERADPAQPKAISSFPDGDKGQRPRSATIAITRDDGGVILS
jgi:uncharacterized protein